jgi:uncharacterized OB-fold protein
MARVRMSEELPPPPQPSLNADTEFFWHGLQQGQLLIQRCTTCGLLRHPPGPSCTACHSLAWDALQSCGVGSLVSFVVVHRPRHPAFTYPLTIGLIELEGGVRLVAPLAANDASRVEIGTRVQAVIDPVAGQHRLPVFRVVHEKLSHA